MAQNALALVAAYNDQIEDLRDVANSTQRLIALMNVDHHRSKASMALKDCKLEMPRIETLQFCCFDLLGCIWQCLWQRGRLYI